MHGARLRGRTLGGVPHPLLRIAPPVRPVAGEQPIQDRSQAVDVDQRINLGVLAQRLFGRLRIPARKGTSFPAGR